MNLVVVGINHRTAALQIRERLWLSEDEMRRAVSSLVQQLLTECLIVSTCNRTELYAVYEPSDVSFGRGSPSIAALKDFLINLRSASDTVRQSHLYELHSHTAVAHLFKVASGIDSMIFGEAQILNQDKEGFGIATEEKTTGVFLNRLVQSALHVAKRVRTETKIAEGAVSISYAAIELANKIFADLSTKSALLIGAGETGELTARHLVGRGIGTLYITNRTRSKADEVVASLGGIAVDFDSFLPKLSHVDVVVSSIASTGYVISNQDVQRAMKERMHKPLFMIDIAVPRNIDPAANKSDNVFLYDMDALAGILDQNMHKRKAELSKANAILLEELTEFHRWYESLQVSPTIQDLRDHFEHIRQEEVARNLNKFSPENRELVNIVTKRIINKLLHTPITNLKNGQEETAEQKQRKLHIIRSLFGLKPATRDDEQTEDGQHS